MKNNPKLALDKHEFIAIRRAGLRLNSLSRINSIDLEKLTNIPMPRCEELIALAQFQILGSVGPNSAEDLWFLGYRKIDELKDENPTEMYKRLEDMRGETIDPCVEDVFRCAVAQVTYPDLPASLKKWWKWKHQRGKPKVEFFD